MIGAQDNTLTLAREYVRPVKLAIPFFLFNQMMAAYLRNDKNPALATGQCWQAVSLIFLAITFLYLYAIWERTEQDWPRLLVLPFFDQSMSVYQEQARIIEEMAQKSDCIIVGRCGD